MFSACSVWENQLGEDLLPPSDRVLLFDTTLFDIDAYTASGIPFRTSDHEGDASLLLMVGSMEDTIVGRSEASLFTQYNLTGRFKPAANTEIDSVILNLVIPSYTGNREGALTLNVYESKQRHYKDSLYYSNHDLTDTYYPEPLATYTYSPGESDTLAIMLHEGPGSAAFLQRFLDVSEDEAVFESDSAFKDYFNGFYITATSESDPGCMANVMLNDGLSFLQLRYANDSTEVDSTAGKDFVWIPFVIDQYSSAKFSVFEHDYSGTFVEGILDQDSLDQSHLYVQGMAGVNTRFRINGIEDWLEEGKVSINSAKIYFDVQPEELSGIPLDDLPDQLMMYLELGKDSILPTYDYLALQQVGEINQFGGNLAREATSMFSDTTYQYFFNMNLQFQSLVDGTAFVNEFRLQVMNARLNPEKCKLWSNLSTNPRRIRLEVVYLKL
jgi:hypothetical protein